MSRICLDCPATISAASSGRCRSCGRKALYADPAARQKMSEAKKQSLKDPAKRAVHAAAASKRLAEWHASTDRDWSAWHKARHAERFAWLPQERRADYQRLRKMRGVGAEKAKAMILEEMARDERRRRAALSPFERQMEALNRGVGLVEKVTLRRPDYAFTLGGVSSGL